MSDPVTGALILSAVLGGASAIQQGQVASANAKSAQNTANYNSQVATNNAVSARQQAAANEEAQRRGAAMQMGRLRAGVAESGVGTDSTAADLYGQSLASADLDAKNILYAGELKGLGLDSEAYSQQQAAQRYGSNASSAVTGSVLSAGTAALSSYNSYNNYQQQSKLLAARS